MQLNETEEMASKLSKMIRGEFGNRIGSSEIFNVFDDESHRTFSVRFHAYNYFIIVFNYDKGRIGCSIQYGEKNYISLENSQQWYEDTNFEIFLKELQEQIELRIPDKFLIAKGWR